MPSQKWRIFYLNNIINNFSMSRLSGLRTIKKNSQQTPTLQAPSPALRLPMPEQEETAYEPTSNLNNTRTSMRLFKNKIQRNSSVQKQGFNQELPTQNTISDGKGSKFTLPEEGRPKLVLNDSPQINEKKPVLQIPKPEKKRINIKREEKEQPKPQLKQQIIIQKKEPQVKKKSPQSQIQQPVPAINSITQEDLQESKDIVQNENDLVICPQGCGRKFNRKALEKHAKACKIVFMSKRKQFNSEAKRITTKQQANIVKQNKVKEKRQFGKSGKGFQKTSDNWKAASQQFRSALKNRKKQQGQQKQADVDIIQAQIKAVTCSYCQKKFNEVFYQTHLQTCAKKKQKEQKQKKKAGKKK